MGEGGGQQYCLKWNNYQESLSSTFSDLLASDTFVDVTLSCEGQKIVRAHRLLLSACSPYFRRLLSGLASSQHPIIILRDVSHSDLVGILEFIYNGEVSIEQECLPGFLAVAETLRIRGLTGESLNDHRESPEMKANVGVQSGQAVEDQSESLPVGEHENSEVEIGGTIAWQGNNGDDLKPCSQFPNLFSAGFFPSDSVGSRACSEETDGGSALPLEEEGGKKICPYCFQQLSWHALSRHIRDMHSSKANADMVVCKYCMKTFRNKNSLGCHIWRFHKRGKELITKERGYQVSKAEVRQQSYEQQTERASHFQETSSALPSLTFQTSINNGNETE